MSLKVWNINRNFSKKNKSFETLIRYMFIKIGTPVWYLQKKTGTLNRRPPPTRTSCVYRLIEDTLDIGSYRNLLRQEIPAVLANQKLRHPYLLDGHPTSLDGRLACDAKRIKPKNICGLSLPLPGSQSNSVRVALLKGYDQSLLPSILGTTWRLCLRRMGKYSS